MKPADEEQELTRLLAQEPSPLAANLGALRSHGPDATELASLASRLALQGLDVSVSRPQAAGPNPWKTWGWGGLGGVSAVVVWLALRGWSPTTAEPARAVTPAAQVASASTAVTARSPGAASHPGGVAGARTARDDEVAAQVEEEVATAANAVASAPSAAPTPLREAAKVVTSSAIPDGDVRRSLNGPSNPSAASVHTGVASSVAKGASSGAALPASTATAPSEMELLRAARLVLRQSPARALELTEEHGRLYPQGKMTQERELIAVSALVTLGRRTAALSRVASFERQYPTSPYRKQMGDLLR